MNSFPSRRGNRGFTLVELLVVIAIIGILAALLLPVLSQGKARAQRAICGNNLSESGIAFHSFGHDHGSKFPMGVSTNENGAMEYVENGYLAGGIFYFGFHVFQSMSNELVRPQLLICPADLARTSASNFPDLQNRNISYFFAGNADFLNASSILEGDRNLATNSVFQPTILQLGNGSVLRWTRELHLLKGNVLFADGHVEEWNASKLKSAADNLSPPADLFMPSISPTSSSSTFGNPGNGGGGGGGSSGGGGGSGSGSSNSGNSMNGSASSQSGSNSGSSSLRPPTPASRTANYGNSVSNSSGGRSGSPPLQNSVNNGLSRSFGANNSQNTPLAKQNEPVAQNTQSNVFVASGDSEPPMSPLDQKIASVLRGTFEWSYFLLLLLLLLFLAYKLWQMLRRNPNRRRAEDDLPPEP